MPVKKTRKPAASVKYLLSGDRKLQQLSLKKIADPAKKTKPRARSTRVKQAMDDEVASTSPKRIGGRLETGEPIHGGQFSGARVPGLGSRGSGFGELWDASHCRGITAG